MIPILDASQIKLCDDFTIKNEPISSVDLMERASGQLFNWITKRFSQQKSFVLFAGTGNNGGDALALARMLHQSDYRNLSIYIAMTGNKLSEDCTLNLNRLKQLGITPNVLNEGDPLPTIAPEDILIDGIFGSGLNRPVTGYWQKLIEHINLYSRLNIAIDVPSGLFCNDNSKNDGAIICATYTLTFQLPKLAFLFAENEKYTGEWYILPIGLDEGFIRRQATDFQLIEKTNIAANLRPRRKFDHKGTFGHAFLIAGSYQKTGAAVLSAKACLRAGVGLLTVHVPQSGYQIMQTAVPEAMLCIDETESGFCRADILDRFSAIGIGPGIGMKQGMRGALKLLIETAKVPFVFDADALNILSDSPELLKMIPENSVLTPHPGEFDRLTKKHSGGYERMETQRQFSIDRQVIVVLKGAFTSISTPDGKVYFNPTGNPGMATAGSGDVLTGIILSLLAQGYQPFSAAITGVFIHGLAGDLASEETGFEALIASDIIENLGKAFIELKRI